jgi:small-conductance mechanosensitive channel
MAGSPASPAHNGSVRLRVFGKTQLIILAVMAALLTLCLVFSWTTRDAMMHLPFLKGQQARTDRPTLVDTSPWQTIQALAPMAVTAEEAEYAHNAERLADHEVDQAFAAALRLATLQTRHRQLTGEALALAQKVAQLQDTIKQDQAQVDALTAGQKSGGTQAKADTQPDAGNDLELAKAQLGLDSDELADAQQDLERASGDNRAQIQGELADHEAAMKPYDSALQNAAAQPAVLSEKQRGTLAGRVKGWFSQDERSALLQQANAQKESDIAKLTAEHNALEAQANATAASDAAGHNTSLADIKDRSTERQILSIDDDRIETAQRLATVYSKWGAQVALQHRIVLHLILQSLMTICAIAIAMVLLDALARRLLSNPTLDRRQAHTLRSIVLLAIQVLGGVLILLVIFGAPQQTTTMLGLATAALTIALQDFILAFLGWFVLMGKSGIHAGDWVEINGVTGEVVDVSLLSTTLLETGNLTEKGQLTGRQIRFLNSFAIRGQYFNFSTVGQWMWDGITVSIAASEDLRATADRIQQAVAAETKENTQLAEADWKLGTHGAGLSQFNADSVLSLRPTAAGVDIEVRYVTRASERVQTRDRLNRLMIELLHEHPKPAE